MAAGDGAPAVSVPDATIVVYESRYFASREFARLLEERGARAFSTQDDVVCLWRGALGDCLDCDTPLIAGLTLHSDYEILRACARERQLRVLREALYRYDTGGPEARSGRRVTLASWLIGR